MKLKLVRMYIFCCMAFICMRSVECAMIPPDIITAIESSTMTSELETYAANNSNIEATDSDGNSMLLIAVQSSFAYFCVQLFNLNATGFATIVNKPNNFAITPLYGSFSNFHGKNDVMRVIQFLFRHGAL